MADLEFRSYFTLIRRQPGPQGYSPDLPNVVPLGTVKDYENYVKRLTAFKTHLQEQIGLMRTGARTGYILPKLVLDAVEESIGALTVEDPAQSLLFAPFDQMLQTSSEADRSQLTDEGRGGNRGIGGACVSVAARLHTARVYFRRENPV